MNPLAANLNVPSHTTMGILLFAKLPKMEGIGFAKILYFRFLPKLVNLS